MNYTDTNNFLDLLAQKINSDKETQIFNALVSFDTIMAVYQKAAWESRRSHRKERSP